MIVLGRNNLALYFGLTLATWQAEELSLAGNFESALDLAQDNSDGLANSEARLDLVDTIRSRYAVWPYL